MSGATTSDAGVPQYASASEPAVVPQFASVGDAGVPQFASVSEPAVVPQFASVSDAGVPEFASANDSPWTPTAAATTFADPYGASASGFSFGAGTGAADPYSSSAGDSSASSGWYSQTAQPVYMTPPANTPSIVGFVLSLLGISLGGIIGGVIGLRKAREFEQQGMPPVGRLLARWAIGISIASIVLLVVLTISAVTIFTAQAAREGVTDYSDTLETATTETLELSATLAATELTGERPVSVTCPSLVREDDGYFHCTAYMKDGRVMDVSVSS
jgi:hypothetical protein